MDKDGRQKDGEICVYLSSGGLFSFVQSEDRPGLASPNAFHGGSDLYSQWWARGAVVLYIAPREGHSLTLLEREQGSTDRSDQEEGVCQKQFTAISPDIRGSVASF